MFLKPALVSLPVLLFSGLLSPASAQTSWELPGQPGDTKVIHSDANGNRVSLLKPGFQAPSRSKPSILKASVGDAWEALGPFGGDVDDVAMSPTNPSVVLAGLAPSSTGGTMYRSTDFGDQWTQVSELSGLDVHVIEFASDGTAFAGTVDGVWSSTDDGASWTQLKLGIGLNDQVFEIVLEGGSSTNIWVGVADAIGSQTMNVLNSSDSGTTWQDRTPAGAAGTSCTGIALNPNDANQVFAVFGGGFSGGSVWRSSNGGAGWVNVSAGLPANPMTDVTFDGTRVLVSGGKLFGSQFVGLFESTNMGASWTALHDGTWPSRVITDIEIDVLDPNLIFLATAGSGVFSTSDGGSTWTFGMAGTTGLSVKSVEISPFGNLPIYIGSTSTAVLRSADGVNFLASSVGIGSLNIEGTAVNPNNSNELLAAFQGLNNGGVYGSLDGGQSWSLEDLPGTRFNQVGFSPDGQGFTLGDGPTTVAAEGLYSRTGNAWSSIGPDQGPQFESELFTMDFATGDSDQIVLGGGDFGVAGFEMTLWKTSNGGATWTKTFEGDDHNDVLDVRFLKDGSDSLLVAAYINTGATQIGGVMRSSNGGATWQKSVTGLNAGVQGSGFGLLSSDPSVIYLADRDTGKGNGGVFKSTDTGLTWAATGYEGLVWDVVPDPIKVGQVYMSSFFVSRAKVSTDDGATFSDYDAGLPSSFAVRDLTLVEGKCNRLLLSTSLGIFSRAASCVFETDVASVSLSAGGVQNWELNAGPALASKLYLFIGTTSGTEPGFPVDGIVMPLNPDAWTTETISLINTLPYTASLGVLDANGQMTGASATVPPASFPSLAGLVLHHAAAVFGGPTGLYAVLASNPQPLTLIP